MGAQAHCAALAEAGAGGAAIGEACFVGASTGGFTDCLLQRGFVRVHAIDVGYGQLDYKLRTDSRVRVGLTATVDVATGRRADVLLLPSRAIVLINDKHTVTLLLADNSQVETQVETGAASGGMTEIVSGLTEGQRVLLPNGE